MEKMTLHISAMKRSFGISVKWVKFFVFEFSIATSYGWIRMGGENKIPADSQWDVFGSLTHRPEQMGTAFWDGVNLAQIHIQSLQKIYL